MAEKEPKIMQVLYRCPNCKTKMFKILGEQAWFCKNDGYSEKYINGKYQGSYLSHRKLKKLKRLNE